MRLISTNFSLLHLFPKQQKHYSSPFSFLVRILDYGHTVFLDYPPDEEFF